MAKTGVTRSWVGLCRQLEVVYTKGLGLCPLVVICEKVMAWWPPKYELEVLQLKNLESKCFFLMDVWHLMFTEEAVGSAQSQRATNCQSICNTWIPRVGERRLNGGKMGCERWRYMFMLSWSALVEKVGWWRALGGLGCVPRCHGGRSLRFKFGMWMCGLGRG